MILRVAGVHLALTLILACISWMSWGPSSLPSVFVGSLISAFELLTLLWAWHQVLRKKGIAFARLIIVLKYPFLGLLIYTAWTTGWFEKFPFAMGIFLLVPDVLVMAVLRDKIIKFGGIE